MKKDKYLRARGGKFRTLDISCAKCGTWLLKYQKDGEGHLLRCYLNRIISPTELAVLQDTPTVREPRDMSNLVCQVCKTVVGTPMWHMDGRLAFRLSKGTFSKQIDKGDS